MDAVRFVRAKADKIAALKDYRGKARPNFLFYLAGEKVEELDGADLPKIQKTIKPWLRLSMWRCITLPIYTTTSVVNCFALC